MISHAQEGDRELDRVDEGHGHGVPERERRPVAVPRVEVRRELADELGEPVVAERSARRGEDECRRGGGLRERGQERVHRGRS